MTRAVLFDLDDTLFDHRASVRAGLVEWQRDHGLDRHDLGALEAIYSELLEAIHLELLAGQVSLADARIRRTTAFFERVGEPGLSPTSADARQIRYRTAYLDARAVVPGALELLDALRVRGLRLGVVTNNLVAEQVDKLAYLGLADRFDAIVISEAAGVAKPDPRIFHQALAALDVAAADAVMVGDSLTSDVRGAEGVGMRAVWLDRDGTSDPAQEPRTVIHALAPLERVLGAILG